MFVSNVRKLIRKIRLTRQIARVTLRLTSERENLEEAEDDYSEFYPSDGHVAAILSLRKLVKNLEEELARLKAENVEEFDK